MMDKEQQLLRNRKQILITAMLDGAAIVAIAFAIFMKASAGGDDVTTNNDWVNMVLGGAIAVAFWCAWRFFKLIRERTALMQQ